MYAGRASTKLTGRATHCTGRRHSKDEFWGVYPEMYDVYRHLKLTPYSRRTLHFRLKGMRKTGGRSEPSKRYRQKRRSKSIRKDFVFTFLHPHSASTKLRVTTPTFKGGKQSL